MNKTYVIKSPMKVTLILTDTTLTIKRKGAMSVILQGLKGDKTIKLKNITSVQLKKPGMTKGYIQFSLSGGNENTKGVFKATQDENSIMFPTKQYGEMLELKGYIDEYDSDSYKPSIKSNAEQIKEFKELCNNGIITQTEFDIKKKQLLNM